MRTDPNDYRELRFQNYLEAMQYQYEFERQFSGKNARPDYAVSMSNGLFLFDVKDLDPYTPLGFMQFDSRPCIREKINRGRKKFKEFKEFPCAVVLQDNGNLQEPPPTDTPKTETGFIGGDGMMIRNGRPQNTTISALVTLR